MIATKPIPLLSRRDEDRFWNAIDKTSSVTNCWLWKGPLLSSRYGQFFTSGKMFRAHRVSFILSGGDDLCNGSLVLHRCRNRHCVNPAHLYSGTQKQNCADREKDGTVARGNRHGSHQHPEIVQGESNGNSKLTESLVRAMRIMRSTGISYKQLGRIFGVTNVHAAYVCKGKNWSHVK